MFKKISAQIEDNFILKNKNLLMTLVLSINLVLCGVYLRLNWDEQAQREEQSAIRLAESLTSQLDLNDIQALSGNETDLEKDEYINIKDNLQKLIENTESITFAYLLGEQGDSIIFYANSEPADSENYTLPGEVYEEATKQVHEPFQTKKTLFISTLKDRWGTWKSVLVPIINPITNETMAIYRLDFNASVWNMNRAREMISDIIIAVLYYIFVLAFFRSTVHYYETKKYTAQSIITGMLYRSVFEQADIGIAIVEDKRFVAKSKYGDKNMNPVFEKILGRSSKELAHISWPDITHPDDLEEDIRLFEQFKNGTIDSYTMFKRFLKPNGSYVWTYMKINHFLDGSSSNPLHLCLISDVTKEKETTDALAESERSKSVFLSNIPGMAYKYIKSNTGWKIVFVSSGCLELTGYNFEDFTEKMDITFVNLIAPEYQKMVWNEWLSAVAKNKSFRFEYEIITATGLRKWVIDMAQASFDEEGNINSLEGILLDISDRKRIENKLKYTYEHDPDTGLLNVNNFHNLIMSEDKKSIRHKRALINVNLSTIQRISMTYGYIYTQNIIKKVAKKLNQLSTEKNTLYKFYDNLFVYYVKSYNDKEELIQFAERVKSFLWEVIKSERIGAGIGIVEIDVDEPININQMSRRVLLASNKSISLNGNEIGICFYDEELEAKMQREEDIKRILNDIAEKNDTEHFYLQFQPILDLKTNKICSFEALARIRNSQLGNISPLDFIPLAEETKLIIPIGWNIFRQAFNFLKQLISSGYIDMVLAINVSAIQLFDDDFKVLLFKMMEEMQIPSGNIVIELTESVFSTDLNEINAILTELRSHGLMISIDDFGTGYSSLARERELKIDSLKIDKSFIDKLMEIRYDEAITADIIKMAHKRGHSVIAEGVEHERQKEYLTQNGCDKIQGFLISRPLDKEAAIEILKKEF